MNVHSQPNRRIGWLKLSLLFWGAVFVTRLSQLQIAGYERYAALAQASQSRSQQIPAERGAIYWYDRSGKTPLALNENAPLLYADPKTVTGKSRVAQQLAAITGDSAEHYLELLQQPTAYVVLKPRLSNEESAQVARLKLAGVGTQDRKFRVYPEGSLAAHVLGFVNGEGLGQYGIEGFFNKELAGQPGLIKATTDVSGIPIATADNTVKPAVAGQTLTLTLDRNVQAQVEKYLHEGAKAVGAKAGSAVVMDPTSGRVLAMANYPSFDPNNFQAVKDYQVFGNRAVSSLFEPGSGFKVIAMAAGLDAGKVTPETTYDDTGSVEVNGYTIRNAANHKFGIQNMTEVIQNSLNTGAIFVLKALGGDANAINAAGKGALYDYVQRFGFGRATGIEQPAEPAGVVNAPKASHVNYANMTFGQGISVTVLQMTAAVGAIANGGKLYKPYLVDELTTAEGKTLRKEPELVTAQVISATAAGQLKEMMVQVVEHGSGWPAKIPGYRVAGKTGTAQIPRADGKGYESNKNIGSFVGFAPVDSPKFVMMVRIDEPNVSGFAESTTVPIFAKVAEWLLRYYAVPPTG